MNKVGMLLVASLCSTACKLYRPDAIPEESMTDVALGEPLAEEVERDRAQRWLRRACRASAAAHATGSLSATARAVVLVDLAESAGWTTDSPTGTRCNAITVKRLHVPPGEDGSTETDGVDTEGTSDVGGAP